MTGRTTRTLIALGSIFLAVAGTACKKNNPVIPDPVEVTENFTGTIQPGGSSSHSFAVNYAFAFSDAAFTVQSLKSVADGSDKNITIGVGYGTINVGVCTRNSAVSNPSVSVNTEISTTAGTFFNSIWCIQIFDNPAAPTVTEPLTYTLKLRHF